MASLLRSSRAKLFSSSSASLSRTFSSPPRSSPLSPPPQIGALPSISHRTTANLPHGDENLSKGNLTGFPKPGAGEVGKLRGLRPLNDPINKLGSDFIKSNPLNYTDTLLNTLVLSRAYHSGSFRVWAPKGPVQLQGVRVTGADSLGLIGHKRIMSTVASATSEAKPYSLRPLSPHLPLYQPQLSSTLSIINRISGAFLAAVILLFYMIYMKMGLISLTYDSFYQFLFYSTKLNLLVVELSGLALSYHLYMTIRHLVH